MSNDIIPPPPYTICNNKMSNDIIPPPPFTICNNKMSNDIIPPPPDKQNTSGILYRNTNT